MCCVLSAVDNECSLSAAECSQCAAETRNSIKEFSVEESVHRGKVSEADESVVRQSE